MVNIELNKKQDKKRLRSNIYEMLMLSRKVGTGQIPTIPVSDYEKDKSATIKFLLYIIGLLIITKLANFNIILVIIDIIFIIYFLMTVFVIIATEIVYRKKFKNIKCKQIIKIGKKEISINENEKSISILKWKDIKCLLIGKYVLKFFPKDEKQIPIFISNNYKEEILEALTKEKIAIDIFDNNEDIIHYNKTMPKQNEKIQKKKSKVIDFIVVALLAILITILIMIPKGYKTLDEAIEKTIHAGKVTAKYNYKNGTLVLIKFANQDSKEFYYQKDNKWYHMDGYTLSGYYYKIGNKYNAVVNYLQKNGNTTSFIQIMSKEDLTIIDANNKKAKRMDSDSYMIDYEGIIDEEYYLVINGERYNFEKVEF